MRRFVYIIIIISLLFVPLKRVKIEHLIPVKAVAVYEYEGGVAIELDTGLKGSGKNVFAAFDSLVQNAPAVVYFKTGEYLFVEEDISDIALIRKQMKNTVKVYKCNAAGRVAEVVSYLDAHGDITNLHDTRTK